MRVKWLVLAVAAVAAGGRTQAGVITLNAVDSGWYNGGIHGSGNDNYFVGEIGSEYRNFFVFDLSSVGENILTAELRLYNPVNGYSSPDATETYDLYDVTTAVGTLTADNGAGNGSAVFADLGTGTQFGSRVVSGADNNTLVSILLNGSAVSNLNAASSLWAIGGRLSTVTPGGSNEFFTGFTGGQFARELVLTTGPAPTVPEPGTLALLGVGGVGMAAGAWRNKRKAVA